MQTREQKIFAALAENLPDVTDCDKVKELRLETSLRKLPSMLLRHGPAQVIVYLHSKGEGHKEAKLLKLFLKVLQSVLEQSGRKESPLSRIKVGLKDEGELRIGGTNRGALSRINKVGLKDEDFRSLAAQPIAERLIDQALCIEVANWLVRAIEGRYQHCIAGQAPGQNEAPQESP